MKTIKYIGSSAVEEFPYTGKYCQWQPGQKQQVDDTRAAALLAADGWGTVSESVNFNSMSDFTNAGGASAFGEGSLYISGQLYWCDGVNIIPSGSVSSFSRAIALGTSITSFYGFPSTGFLSGAGAQAQSWLFWLNAAVKGSFTSILNKGVSGNTTSQMVARYTTDVQANYGAYDVMFFEPGPNDMNDGSMTYATIISNYQYIISRASANFKLVVVLTPTIKTTQTTADQVKRAQCIAYLQTYCVTFNNVVLINTDDVFVSAQTGSSIASMLADGVHPSVEGACALGRLVARNISEFVSPKNLVGGQRRNPREYIPNPRFAGVNVTGANGYQAGTGVTGSGPDGTVVGIVSGTFSTAAVSAPTINGTEDYPDGGMIITATATSASAKLRVTCGGNYQVFGGTVQAGAYSGPNWAATTAYTSTQRVLLPAYPLGMLTVTTAGTSGATTPAPTTADNYGEIITDGTVTYMWQKKPVAGDKFIAEIDYEITSLTGGIWIDAMTFMLRFSLTAGECFGNTYFPNTAVSGNAPTLQIPRRGVLRSNVVTLADPGVALRYIETDIDFVFANGASAVIKLNRVSVLNV